jgi:hypothetical protein
LCNVDHKGGSESEQGRSEYDLINDEDDRDGERRDDRGDGDRLRPDREANSGSPISNDAAEQPVLDEPLIEALRRLGEEEGGQENGAHCRDEGDDNADERESKEEDPGYAVDGSKHATFDDGHRAPTIPLSAADSESDFGYIRGMSWLDRLFVKRALTAKFAGEPTSGNGASSFHLWWDVPHRELLTAVSATLEILEPPAVDRLYFWALQVSFVKPGGGGAHLGLQHHPRFPGRTAANWGGYAPSADGALLEGSHSPLPSTPGDTNTRDFPWVPHRSYRLTIGRSSDEAPEGMHAWRGTIGDLRTGEVTVVRDLFSRGEYLRGPVVWTESFARCDHPPVAVRWSDLLAVGETDQPVTVTSVSANFQDRAAGGCDNTDATVDGAGWVQRTTSERTIRSGVRLELPRAL